MPDTNQIKVLVVEDNLDDQEFLKRHLRKTPLSERVHFTSDPRVALELLQMDAPKWSATLIAIFIDVHLPFMTGIDLLRLIRDMPEFTVMPIIVMTSSPHPNTIKACQELNVAAFVEKPITPASFAKNIANLFHRSQMAAP